jgi:hypothetical protein
VTVMRKIQSLELWQAAKESGYSRSEIVLREVQILECFRSPILFGRSLSQFDSKSNDSSTFKSPILSLMKSAIQRNVFDESRAVTLDSPVTK